jgi:hypothetical protein
MLHPPIADMHGSIYAQGGSMQQMLANSTGACMEGKAMSIHQMIALHPDVAGNLNETLATAARHAMFCSLMCTSCADACAAEEMDMRQCIRSCLDCADVCDATARLSVRRTGQNIEALKAMLETCVRICDRCAAECERHDHEHCKLCAQMCTECSRDCAAAIPTVN